MCRISINGSTHTHVHTHTHTHTLSLSLSVSLSPSNLLSLSLSYISHRSALQAEAASARDALKRTRLALSDSLVPKAADLAAQRDELQRLNAHVAFGRSLAALNRPPATVPAPVRSYLDANQHRPSYAAGVSGGSGNRFGDAASAPLGGADRSSAVQGSVEGLRAALDRAQTHQTDVIDAAEAALRSYGDDRKRGSSSAGATAAPDEALGAVLVLAATDNSFSSPSMSSSSNDGLTSAEADVNAAAASGDVAKEIAALRAVVAATEAEKKTMEKLRGSAERYVINRLIKSYILALFLIINRKVILCSSIP